LISGKSQDKNFICHNPSDETAIQETETPKEKIKAAFHEILSPFCRAA